MKLEVLVATMHRQNYKLIEKMNISTDAVVINQCDEEYVTSFSHKGRMVRWFSCAERGIGVSRNTAILKSQGDILLFADDDVVYTDDYETAVVGFFEDHPDVGLAVFNLKSQNPDRPEFEDSKEHPLRWYNCLRYGACRIAVRRQCLLHNNVWFSLLFGGGAKHQAGEDNLFINDCMKAGIRCVASDITIGTVAQEESTWFKGYDARYFTDRGALLAAMYGKRAYIMAVLMEIRGSARTLPFSQRLACAFQGIQGYQDVRRGKHT